MQEQRARFRERCGFFGRVAVHSDPFVCRVILHHSAAVEIAVWIAIADCADMFFYSVKGFAEDDRGGEERFLVAAADSALAEDRVVDIRAEEIVVGG